MNILMKSRHRLSHSFVGGWRNCWIVGLREVPLEVGDEDLLEALTFKWILDLFSLLEKKCVCTCIHIICIDTLARDWQALNDPRLKQPVFLEMGSPRPLHQSDAYGPLKQPVSSVDSHQGRITSCLYVDPRTLHAYHIIIAWVAVAADKHQAEVECMWPGRHPPFGFGSCMQRVNELMLSFDDRVNSFFCGPGRAQSGMGGTALWGLEMTTFISISIQCSCALSISCGPSKKQNHAHIYLHVLDWWILSLYQVSCV